MIDPFLSALLRGSWFIDEAFANSSLPMVMGILSGTKLGTELLSGAGDSEMPFFIGPDGQRRDAFAYSRGQMVFSPEAAVPGSIAVVPFIGPMIKYNGSCGEPGMIKRQQWISQMTSLNNVVGYMSLMDTPGGQADGTPQTANFIKSLKIPTAALVIGMACSAGAWIASGHDVTYAADEFSEFGSIGAYRMIVDPTGAYEKEGYKVITIYPKVSDDKNKSYREALKGNTKLIEDETTDLAQSFIDNFAANREGHLKSDDWKTGKVFSAAKATEMGLITGIMTMNEVAQLLRSGTVTKSKSSNNNKMETKNLEQLAGVANPTQDQLDLANADLAAAGITGAAIMPESLVNEAVNVTKERDALLGEKNGLSTKLEESNTALTAANTRIADLEAKVEAFGKNAGAANNQAKGADAAADADTATDNLDNLPHNQYAKEFLS